MRHLFLAIALVSISPAFAAQSQANWERSMLDAERAFEMKDYWTARRLFTQSMSQAQECQEVLKLAQRLDALSDEYARKRRTHVAAALHRQAEKLYASINACAPQVITLRQGQY